MKQVVREHYGSFVIVDGKVFLLDQSMLEDEQNELEDACRLEEQTRVQSSD